jgi:hypothetical protein
VIFRRVNLKEQPSRKSRNKAVIIVIFRRVNLKEQPSRKSRNKVLFL